MIIKISLTTLFIRNYRSHFALWKEERKSKLVINVIPFLQKTKQKKTSKSFLISSFAFNSNEGGVDWRNAKYRDASSLLLFDERK